MREFLKLNFKWLVLAFLVMFLFFEVQSRRESKKDAEINELKGKVEAGEQALLVKDKTIEEMTKAHEEKIGELNGYIDSVNTQIEKLKGVDNELAGTIKSLEEAEANITDKDELIANLRNQIAGWRERFDLSIRTLKEKDQVIFSLTEKYDGERKLRLEIQADRESWKSQYHELKNLQIDTSKALAKARNTSRLEKIGLAVLAGVALVSIAK